MSDQIGTYQQRVNSEKYSRGYELTFGKKPKKVVKKEEEREVWALLHDRGPGHETARD